MLVRRAGRNGLKRTGIVQARADDRVCRIRRHRVFIILAGTRGRIDGHLFEVRLQIRIGSVYRNARTCRVCIVVALYSSSAVAISLRFASQAAVCACALARTKFGTSIATRIAMIATTTIISMSVKPRSLSSLTLDPPCGCVSAAKLRESGTMETGRVPPRIPDAARDDVER